MKPVVAAVGLAGTIASVWWFALKPRRKRAQPTVVGATPADGLTPVGRAVDLARSRSAPRQRQRPVQHPPQRLEGRGRVPARDEGMGEVVETLAGEEPVQGGVQGAAEVGAAPVENRSVPWVSMTTNPSEWLMS